MISRQRVTSLFAKPRRTTFFGWDADDILKEEDCNKLIALKADLESSVDSVTMFYNYAFDEFGNPISRFKRNRLVKRENQFKWIGAIHEYLEVNGHILDSDITVTHCKIHNTERQESKNIPEQVVCVERRSRLGTYITTRMN